MFRVFATTEQRMPLSQIAQHARRAEKLGYDGLNVPEAVHDGLLAAAAALAATEHLSVATSVLVAFPRSPMTVAHAAWDLQETSGGRFELGLGPQVRANIVNRYSTSWTAPVPRMRDYVNSLRAIFDCWQNGSALQFEGAHYQFSRMQPFFHPGPVTGGPPPIHLGAIGPGMLALAGELADGLMTHPTNTAPRYLREAIIPRLAEGAKRVGRTGDALRLMIGGLCATGPNDEQTSSERENARQLLGFLYSTPAYWKSLELLGLDDLGPRLKAMVAEGRWSDLAGQVPDSLVDATVPSAPYAEIAERLTDWYGELSDWITFPMPDDPACDDAAADVITRLKSG
ncbi:MAG: TIGR03617 family F420-dependent LLM class oxidoreductase [Myxococcota bacterium]